MLTYLLKGIIVGILLLAIFEIIERVRLATGKEMLIDKMLVYLEGIYRRTEPKDSDEPDVRDYSSSDKITVRKVYFLQKEKEGD